MTYFERLEEMKKGVVLDLNNMHEAYYEAESKLVKLVSEQIKSAEISSTTCGTGLVLNSYGDTLDQMVMEVNFFDSIKKFAVLPVIMGNTLFVKFSDILEIGDTWDAAYEFHKELTARYNELKREEEKLKVEAQKKAEAEKKAEIKYQQLKEKALRDFETLANKPSEPIENFNEFYYALGWLAKHANSVTAVLPDYLKDAFIKYFGDETPCRVVDSKKRGPAGWQSQWSWAFSIGLKKSEEEIPAILTKYLNPKGKAITNTSFIWDLIDDFGFQFGKKQDFDRIEKMVPVKYFASYQAGFAE